MDGNAALAEALKSVPTSKVFVVHPVLDNITAAAQYGQFQYVCKRYVYPDEIEGELLPDGVKTKIEEAARSYRPGLDYVLLVGDHLQIVALVWAVSKLHRGLTVLRYDRKAGGYYPVWITGQN